MKPFSLVGVDGNAFSVMAYTSNAMKQAGYESDEIQQYRKVAMSGNYDALICLSCEYIDKCNEILNLEEDYEECEEEVEW